MARRSARPVRWVAIKAGLLLLELVVPIGLVVGWWAWSADSSSLYFPPLHQIVTSLHEQWLFSHFGSDAVPSLVNLAVGYVVATAVGVSVGVLLGLTPVLRDATTPIVEFLRAIPGVALLPAAVLLLGVGPSMRISLIAYGTVWPILLNAIDGVRSVNPTVIEVTRSYRISLWQRLVRVVLPAASPQIVAGMRTALSIGITIIVFSEMVGSTNGIGYQLLQAQRSFAVADMWAGMVLLGILGYLLNLGFRGFERVVLAWHHGMRHVSRS